MAFKKLTTEILPELELIRTIKGFNKFPGVTITSWNKNVGYCIVEVQYSYDIMSYSTKIEGFTIWIDGRTPSEIEKIITNLL